MTDESPGTSIKAFLIADVRGYTLFTQERGDEAAAKLAAKFAAVAREVVAARGGEVIELRGDEALAVFDSPRQAIRAAVDLQDRFVEETLADPAIPLTVGIGLDAGEAVPVEGGYRGGALNLAARLCGQAGPGDVLASQEIVHLARRIEGVDYADRGAMHLKGLSEPVRVVRVSSAERDAAVALRPVVASRPSPGPTAPPPRRRRRRWAAVAIVAAVAVAAAVLVPIALRNGQAGLDAVPANSIGRIDPANGRIVDSFPLSASPGQVAVGAGSVWVTHPDDGKVTRLDPATGVARDTIPVGVSPAGIAVGEGAVWVVDGGGRAVDRIDPATGDVRSYTVGNGPVDVALGQGSVWVTNRLDGTVSRLAPDTGDVQATIPVGDGPTGVAVTNDGVWVAISGTGRLVEIDPGPNHVVASVGVGNGPGAVAAGPDGVWVANTLDDTVARIDPSIPSVAETIPVGLGPADFAFTGGAVWVTDEFGGTLARIDPAGHRVNATINTGSEPRGLAVVDGDLWVAARGAATSHRGGTLRIDADEPPLSIDPALSYDRALYQLLSVTNDGLVGFKRVGGAEGSTLVPDLATSLPAPTDGSRTYSFRLRGGLRYSNGAPVRASDVRRSFERDYRAPRIDIAIPAFYDVIEGATACREDPSRCDLSAGIVTDDAAGTVVFHLTAPDGEFLDKLALPFAAVLPSGVPGARPGSTTPLPATGPYRIERFDPKTGLTLVRNRQFHEWSGAAQPDGFPDRIEFRYRIPPARQVADVEAGRADVMLDDPPPDALPALNSRFAAQVHPYPRIQTFYLALNATRAPFDDPRVRRAVALATDRRKLLEIFGGPGRGRITCQLLPPNSPGYVPYCPSTLDPNPGGEWTAPDVAEAQRLVDASHTKGKHVEIWPAPYFPEMQAWGRYFAGLLTHLGYHATVHAPSQEYVAQAYPPGPGVQAAIDGWVADYPSAENFLKQLQCGDPTSIARLCDPSLDSAIRRAGQTEASHPEEASALWAGVDHHATDIAALVDFLNPSGFDFVARGVGNYQHNVQLGILLSQLWVR
jgi:YVTN family beta-propeller protein